jgi:transposase
MGEASRMRRRSNECSQDVRFVRMPVGQEDPPMSDQYWLSEAQLERIKPYFPRSHGRPRVDDRRVISGIVHVIRNGLRWRDAPEVYGPHKTPYNRFLRWSRIGVVRQINGF